MSGLVVLCYFMNRRIVFVNLLFLPPCLIIINLIISIFMQRPGILQSIVTYIYFIFRSKPQSCQRTDARTGRESDSSYRLG